MLLCKFFGPSMHSMTGARKMRPDGEACFPVCLEVGWDACRLAPAACRPPPAAGACRLPPAARRLPRPLFVGKLAHALRLWLYNIRGAEPPFLRVCARRMELELLFCL